jgi:hypothetical protein
MKIIAYQGTESIMIVTVNHKHTSLLQYSIICGGKKFYSMGQTEHNFKREEWKRKPQSWKEKKVF